MVALGEFADLSEAGMQVVGKLGTLDPESANESLRRLRVYAGYAGWGAGQLDGELEQEAWLVAPAEEDDPFSARRHLVARARAQGRRLPAARDDAAGSLAELGSAAAVVPVQDRRHAARLARRAPRLGGLGARLPSRVHVDQVDHAAARRWAPPTIACQSITRQVRGRAASSLGASDES